MNSHLTIQELFGSKSRLVLLLRDVDFCLTSSEEAERNVKAAVTTDKSKKHHQTLSIYCLMAAFLQLLRRK